MQMDWVLLSLAICKNLNPTGSLLPSLKILKNIFMQRIGSHFLSAFQKIFILMHDEFCSDDR
jgi:hypothetical protein